MRITNWLLLGALASASVPAFGSEAHMRAFGPQSVVRVARPTLRWEVWPGKGSSITDAAMSINGRNVRATYDADGKALLYTPSQNLAPGDYKVEAKVMVDGFMPVKKEWDFTVATGAATKVPEPSADQLRAVDAVNEIRARIGLQPFQADNRLCAAAMAHTNYLKLNGLTGHYQHAGDPGFVGQTPAERLDAFGYGDSSWEGVDFGSQSVHDSLRRLYDAPYHRLPFLQPGTTVVGAGFLSSHMTLEFGMSGQTGTVVSPAPQEQGVPLTWSGPERPDPLAVHHMSGVVGYPIVFAHFTPSGEKISVRRARLTTGDGDAVEIALNTPENDEHLDFAAILIPVRPLRPNMVYEASVDAVTASGKAVSTTWRFMTGSR